MYACFSPKSLVKKSSSGGNSSSGNSSSQFVFGGEFVFGGQFVFGEFVFGIRLRVGIRLRGAIRLRGIRLRNSSSEFVFVCGWKCLARTAGAMYIYIWLYHDCCGEIFLNSLAKEAPSYPDEICSWELDTGTIGNHQRSSQGASPLINWAIRPMPWLGHQQWLRLKCEMSSNVRGGSFGRQLL